MGFLSGLLGKIDVLQRKPNANSDVRWDPSWPHFVVTFWSPKGGTGKTTAAVNTCSCLQSYVGARCVIVDMDEFGDVAVSMGFNDADKIKLSEPAMFLKAMKAFGADAACETNLLVHESGLRAMTHQPVGVDKHLRVRPDEYKMIGQELIKRFDIVAFDCGDRLYDDYVRFALINADVLVIIADQGYTTLKDVSDALLDIYKANDLFKRERTILVMNRFRNAVDVSMKQLEKTFGQYVAKIERIDADDAGFLQMLNTGKIAVLSDVSANIKAQYMALAKDIIELGTSP